MKINEAIINFHLFSTPDRFAPGEILRDNVSRIAVGLIKRIMLLNFVISVYVS